MKMHLKILSGEMAAIYLQPYMYDHSGTDQNLSYNFEGLHHASVPLY